MLKEVRDTGLTGLLIAPSNSHDNRTCKDRGVATSIKNNFQAIREGVRFDL
jgi:gas vesicle protein